MNAYQDQLNSKVCDVHHSIKLAQPSWMNNLLDARRPVIVVTSTLLFHAPKHEMEQNNLWLVALHVRQTCSWVLDQSSEGL